MMGKHEIKNNILTINSKWTQRELKHFFDSSEGRSRLKKNRFIIFEDGTEFVYKSNYSAISDRVIFIKNNTRIRLGARNFVIIKGENNYVQTGYGNIVDIRNINNSITCSEYCQIFLHSTQNSFWYDKGKRCKYIKIEETTKYIKTTDLGETQYDKLFSFQFEKSIYEFNAVNFYRFKKNNKFMYFITKTIWDRETTIGTSNPIQLCKIKDDIFNVDYIKLEEFFRGMIGEDFSFLSLIF